MLRPFASIQIQQIPSIKWKQRNSLMTLDFYHKYQIDNGWEDHTDTASLYFPKNVVLQNGDFLFKQKGTYNVILGSSAGNGTIESLNDPQFAPLISKGDIIYIQDGYLYRDEFGNSQQVGATHFEGYVSKTFSDTPIRVELEDNFYLLKRTPLDVTNWKGSLIDLCKHIINLVNTNFGLNSLYEINGINPYPILTMFEGVDSLTANFSLGYLDIGNATCSQVLSKIRSNYNLESFFVGNELHFGFPIYNESTANSSYVFEFRNNIKDDCNLEYWNKDDIQLSAIINCTVISSTGKTTKDGYAKTKAERLSILVYWDIQDQVFKYLTKKKGEKFPDNETGERRTFIYPVESSAPLPSESELFDFGKKQLEKYFYTGFKGSFKTIGFPIINWGDNITMLDSILSDRNGVYKVKKVVRTGENGIEQEIFIDFKLNVSVDKRLLEKPYNGSYIYMI